MLKLDKNFLNYLLENKIKKVKIFFYKAGCSWTKIDVIFDDFLEKDLLNIMSIWEVKIFVEENDKEKFENGVITRTIIADHTWAEKIRYVFINKDIKERCGCGSSFSFEKKVPKIDLNKLKDLKKNFGK